MAVAVIVFVFVMNFLNVTSVYIVVLFLNFSCVVLFVLVVPMSSSMMYFSAFALTIRSLFMLLYSDDDLSKLFSKVKESYDLLRAIKTRTERKRVKEYNESVFSYREKVARSHLFPDEFYSLKIHNDRIEVCRSSKGLYYIACNCCALYENRWHPSFPIADGSFFRESSCAFNYFPTRDFYQIIRAFPEVIKAYLAFEYKLEIF